MSLSLIMATASSASSSMPPICNPVINVVDESNVTPEDLTVCAGTELTFSTPVTDVASAIWVIGGLTSVGLLPQSHTFAQEGQYEVVLTTTDLLGCEGQSSVTVIVLGNPPVETTWVQPSCASICDGQLFTGLETDLLSYYQVHWTGPLGNDLEGFELYGLCGGDYQLSLEDQLGCSDHSTLHSFDEPAALEVSFLSPDPILICPDEPAFQLNALPLGGTGVLTVSWSNTAGLSDPESASPWFDPAPENINQLLQVTVTDENQCSASAGLQISARPSDLVGEVFLDGEPCDGCALMCYKTGDPGVWDVWGSATATTTADGLYAMPNIGGLVNCILKLVPPADAPANLPPLYYAFPEPVHNWMDATVITTGCGPDNVVSKDLSAYSMPEMSGNTSISGSLVYEYTGKMQAEDPIPHIDVVVEKVPPGNALQSVTTNDFGEFSFEFVPETLGDTVYHFYVDIPGVPMQDTYILTISADDELVENVKFCLSEDSTLIYTCADISVGRKDPDGRGSLMIFPNPANEVVQFRVKGSGAAITEVVLIDLTGRAVRSPQPDTSDFELSVNGLTAGLYTAIVRLSDGTVMSERLMVGR